MSFLRHFRITAVLVVLACLTWALPAQAGSHRQEHHTGGYLVVTDWWYTWDAAGRFATSKVEAYNGPALVRNLIVLEIRGCDRWRPLYTSQHQSYLDVLSPATDALQTVKQLDERRQIVLDLINHGARLRLVIKQAAVDPYGAELLRVQRFHYFPVHAGFAHPSCA